MRASLLILVLSTGAVLSNRAAADDFDSLIKQGRAAYQASDLDTAETTDTKACRAEQAAAFPLQKGALCENEFGAIAEARGRNDEAAIHYLKALTAWEKLGRPYLPQYVTTLTNLGGLYRRQHRMNDAEKILDRALELAKGVAATEPQLHAIVLSRSAGLYAELDRTDRALAMLDQAIEGLRALTTPNSPELAWAYNSLGMIQLSLGHYKSGESNLRQAVAFAAESLGETDPETAAYGTNLALALLVQGQYNRAETLLRRARFVIESRLGPDSVDLVNVLAELSSVEAGLGRFQIAEDCGEKALSILNRHVPAGSLEILLIQVNMGRVYLREHKIVEAEKILPVAVDAERRFFKDGRTLGDGIRNLAALRAQQHAWNDAESLYREAIGIYEEKLGPDHPDIAPVLREYAAVLKHEGVSKSKIRSVEARARAIANPQAS